MTICQVDYESDYRRCKRCNKTIPLSQILCRKCEEEVEEKENDNTI